MEAIEGIGAATRNTLRRSSSTHRFDTIHNEVSGTLQAYGLTSADSEDEGTDPDTVSTRSERIAYWIENLVAAHPNGYFYLLFGLTMVALQLLGGLWTLADRKEENAIRFGQAVFYTFQVFASGGFTEVFQDASHTIIYIMMLLCGVLLFALLISMITDGFQNFVSSMSEGKTKVPISNHTLILGWNESTVRVICQLALIRRQFHMQNDTCLRRICRWRRTKATTPVAEAPIVVMNNRHSKAAMQSAILQAFTEAGISRRRTRVGRDVICRVGDPTLLNDLQRVGAQRAKAILVQTTEDDDEEAREHQGSLTNGVTMRTLLALRLVLFSLRQRPCLEDLRVVAQLGSPIGALDEIDLGRSQTGRPILTFQELSTFVNSLLFTCISQPGLAFALLELLSFKGKAFRLRKVTDFRFKDKLIGCRVRDTALMWEDAVLVGIVDECDVHDTRAGLAICGDYIIKETDRLVFICERSMPRLARGIHQDIGVPVDTSLSLEGQPVALLVCGWRKEWNLPDRFEHQLCETCAELPTGSKIMLLNVKGAAEDEEWFEEYMARVCKVKQHISPAITAGTRLVTPTMEAITRKQSDVCTVDKWVFREGQVEINHTYGDAAIFADLEVVIKAHAYDKAIILSTMANKEMTPFSCDSRIMSIMLQLRKLQRKHHNQRPLHVIGENSMDGTAILAMGPASQTSFMDYDELPDFVNVQAIYACALAQSLAYPRMQSHVSQLFSGKPGSPSLRLFDAMDLIPTGMFSFGSIVKLVKQAMPDDILIGFRRACGRMELVPSLSQSCSLAQGDKLLIITRRLSNFQQAELQEQKMDHLRAKTGDAPFAPLTPRHSLPPAPPSFVVDMPASTGQGSVEKC